ncbi:MAG: hypothetical protein WC004_03845 [Candidatus Absconditabacterales bacterium]
MSSSVEKQKSRAISVNNKPQHYKPQEIAIALKIVKTLEVGHFDHPIQREHLIQALQHHLVQSGNVSDTNVKPNSNVL